MSGGAETYHAELAERDARIVALHAEQHAHSEIAAELGVTIHIVRNALKFASKAKAMAIIPASPQGEVALYEAMVAAIAAVKAVDEAKDIADRAEAMRVYARQAKNRDAEIDAAEIRIRAERRIGELIGEAKAVGQIAEGRPRAENPATREGFSRVALADAGIDHKLSSRAQQLAKLPDDEFAWQLSGWRDKAKEEGARVTVRLLKGDAQKTKAEARAVKEELLGRIQLESHEPIYGVVLEDFEWDYQVRSRETGMDRHASNHYPTANGAHTPEEIVACTAERMKCGAPDCLLAMWVPVPHLAIGVEVMRLRGFKYVSSGVWVKYKPGAGIGMGHWMRIDHEILLLGARGKIMCPAEGMQRRSVFDIPASRRHSEKPEAVAEMLEHYFPTLPKIELNRRGPARAGWSAWGNEVEDSRAKAEEAVRPDKAQAKGMLPRGEEGSDAELTDDAASRLSAGRTADATEVEGRDQPGRAAGTSIDDLEIPAFLRRNAA